MALSERTKELILAGLESLKADMRRKYGFRYNLDATMFQHELRTAREEFECIR